MRPLAGAVYLIDPTLQPEFQTLPLAAQGASRGLIEWYVDGALVGRAGPDATVRWPLIRGSHRITARDSAGRSAATQVVVR